MEKEILHLAAEYPKNRVVISSRPDDTFASWIAFHVFQVQPLSQQQIVKLIKKLDYDPEVKAKFTKEIQARLYVQHEEFLSNPLLATMMLLTYDQFADIPSKVHVFYQQAFETLFQKHDALKAVYRRKNHSGLAIDEFKRVFASFCALTYFDEKFGFDDESFRSYIERALLISGVNSTAEAVARDLLESVCVIERDGLKLIFVHRSFQEYFTSYFIVAMNADRAGAFLERLAQRPARARDSVVSMCFDMNSDIVEAQWALPTMKRIADQLPADPDDFEATYQVFFHSPMIAVFPGEKGEPQDDMAVHILGDSKHQELRLLADLYVWRPWDRAAADAQQQTDRKFMRSLLAGHSEVFAPTTHFAALLSGILNGELKSIAGRLVEISEQPFHEKNLAWLRQSSAMRVAMKYGEFLRETILYVEKRARAREKLFDVLLKSN